MKWHKMTDISRIIKTTYPKGFWNNLISIVAGMGGPYHTYQHGIKLINERGETKDVWEKKNE